MDNEMKEKLEKDVDDGIEIPDEEMFTHTNEFFEATSEIIATMRDVMDDSDRDGIDELLDLEREHIEDEPNTIDDVTDLGAKFFKPIPREVIDARIAPLLANAPEPTITEGHVEEEEHTRSPVDNDPNDRRRSVKDAITVNGQHLHNESENELRESRGVPIPVLVPPGGDVPDEDVPRAAAEPAILELNDPTAANAVGLNVHQLFSSKCPDFDEVLEAQILIRDVMNHVPTSRLYERETDARSCKAFTLFCFMWSLDVFAVNTDEEDGRITVSMA
ncbi:uncharacterized protein LOC119078220 [Bradysia coprophila]|uniref:uncharacterized protein LOC119078220 n=1 Tax=Bradysia coprophila TaxID=38358 RepID=UPI00187DB6D6|nr:uncharacterized protein LOC119078220 [Bradysia coprophila]